MTDRERDEIEHVIAAIRERAKGYRETEVWACQSDASWHADEYDEWADRLEAVLRRSRAVLSAPESWLKDELAAAAQNANHYALSTAPKAAEECQFWRGRWSALRNVQSQQVDALGEAAETRAVPADPFDSAVTWRCSDCGDARTVDDPRWRWNGSLWQHAHSYGHVDASAFSRWSIS